MYSFSSALKLLGVFRSGNGDFMEITVEWLITFGFGVGFVLFTIVSLLGFVLRECISLFHIVK